MITAAYQMNTGEQKSPLWDRFWAWYKPNQDRASAWYKNYRQEHIASRAEILGAWAAFAAFLSTIAVLAYLEIGKPWGGVIIIVVTIAVALAVQLLVPASWRLAERRSKTPSKIFISKSK